MTDEKPKFKYPLTHKKAIRYSKNITFRCEEGMKALEEELLNNGVDLADHYRRAAWEILREQKEQLDKKNKTA